MRELHDDARAIARRQEARTHQFGHDRIPHHKVTIRLADAVLCPRHGHQLQRAVEIGNGELDPRHAVAFDIDTMPERLRRIASDPWEGIDEVRQALPAGSGVA